MTLEPLVGANPPRGAATAATTIPSQRPDCSTRTRRREQSATLSNPLPVRDFPYRGRRVETQRACLTHPPCRVGRRRAASRATPHPPRWRPATHRCQPINPPHGHVHDSPPPRPPPTATTLPADRSTEAPVARPGDPARYSPRQGRPGPTAGGISTAGPGPNTKAPPDSLFQNPQSAASRNGRRQPFRQRQPRRRSRAPARATAVAKPALERCTRWRHVAPQHTIPRRDGWNTTPHPGTRPLLRLRPMSPLPPALIRRRPDDESRAWAA